MEQANLVDGDGANILEVYTNTPNNLDKYILEFAQIHLSIRTNTFCQSKQMCSTNCNRNAGRPVWKLELPCVEPSCNVTT